jgi:hypothetical protein
MSDKPITVLIFITFKVIPIPIISAGAAAGNHSIIPKQVISPETILPLAVHLITRLICWEISVIQTFA